MIKDHFFNRYQIKLDSEINYVDAQQERGILYLCNSEGIFTYNIHSMELNRKLKYEEGVEKFNILSNKDIIFISDGNLMLYTKKKIFNLINDNNIISVRDFLIDLNENMIFFIAEIINEYKLDSELSSYGIYALDFKWRYFKKITDKIYSIIPSFIDIINGTILLFDNENELFNIIKIDINDYEYLNILEKINNIESITLCNEEIYYSIYENNVKTLYQQNHEKNKLICNIEGEKGHLNIFKISPNKKWMIYLNTLISKSYLILMHIKTKNMYIIEYLKPESNIYWTLSGNEIVYTNDSFLYVLRSNFLSCSHT